MVTPGTAVAEKWSKWPAVAEKADNTKGTTKAKATSPGKAEATPQ